MIRALIFDCFGVLYSDGKSHIQNLCPPDKRQELKDLYAQADYGYISGQDFSKQAAILLGLPLDELEHIFLNQNVRNQQLLDFIMDKRRTLKVGLLSNVGDDLMNKLFSQEEQATLFDTVVLSSAVGYIKPSRQIYELTAARLGVAPEECIFIDDLPINVDGARIAGMEAFLYTTNHQLEEDIRRSLGRTDA